MCGIAGIIRSNGQPVVEEDLAPMARALEHRGPDGVGIHSEGEIGIANTRLAIIDVAGGKQPIFNEDRTLAIVCNGEIYNHVALRAELERGGHRFRTRSDVEVILHLYEDYGTRCFQRLNGMFAVAIADFRGKRLVLARDRFGQKPLYVWKGQSAVVFASELKALRQMPGLPCRPSDLALASFLTFRYVPAPLSIMDGVEKLLPGSYACVDTSGGWDAGKYWRIEFGAAEPGRTYTPGEMLQQLKDSVARHLMSERPVGVFLSGGVDSSAIVACMNLLGHQGVHTYTVGFDGFEGNELEAARRIANHFSTRHTEVVLDSEAFWNTLDQVACAADEPLADLTSVALYHLSAQARRDVVVVQSGEGSDELLGGYQGTEDLRRMFDMLRFSRPLRPLARALARWHWPDGIARRLLTLGGSDSDYLVRNPFTMSLVFDGQFWRDCGTDGVLHQATLEPLRSYYAARPDWHGLNLYLGGLIEWWLPDDLLHKADRMTMAHSVELRCPFLDADFAAYCAALPLDLRVGWRRGEAHRKIALKRAVAELLPHGFVYQSKKGFPIPAYSWLAGVLAGRARAEVLRRDALGSSLFQKKTLNELSERAVAGDLKSQRRVWSIIVLNKWGDRWL